MVDVVRVLVLAEVEVVDVRVEVLAVVVRVVVVAVVDVVVVVVATHTQTQISQCFTRGDLHACNHLFVMAVALLLGQLTFVSALGRHSNSMIQLRVSEH